MTLYFPSWWYLSCVLIVNMTQEHKEQSVSYFVFSNDPRECVTFKRHLTGSGLSSRRIGSFKTTRNIPIPLVIVYRNPHTKRRCLGHRRRLICTFLWTCQHAVVVGKWPMYPVDTNPVTLRVRHRSPPLNGNRLPKMKTHVGTFGGDVVFRHVVSRYIVGYSAEAGHNVNETGNKESV